MSWLGDKKNTTRVEKLLRCKELTHQLIDLELKKVATLNTLVQALDQEIDKSRRAVPAMRKALGLDGLSA